MIRHLLVIPGLLIACLVSALLCSSGARAELQATATPVASATATAGPTPVPTPSPAAPAIRITKVDMFRHVGGEFFSTRQIRIGHLMRWIVYFHLDHPGATLPSCHVAVSHDGHVFYEDAMWRKRGKNYFFLDGRFRSVYGPTLATFTLRQGPATATTELEFKVKLPKF